MIMQPPIIGQSAKGRWFWQVTTPKGKVVRQARGWRPNLILNDGMDRVAVDAWCDCFTYATAGTGTNSNYVYSGTTKASQTGITVTADAAIFSVADVGKCLYWATAPVAQAFITGYTSPTQVTVRESQSVILFPFYVVNTKQTGLQAELKRTNTYITGITYCFTTRTGDYLTIRRSYIFSAEIAPVDYREFGLSWAAAGVSTHFARFTTDEPVSVGTGNQLRLIYETRLTMFPASARYVEVNPVVGWPYPGVSQSKYYDGLQYIGLSSVASSGVSTAFDTGYYTNEPSANGGANVFAFFSSTSTPLNSLGSSVGRVGGAILSRAPTYVAYIANSFYRDRTVVLTASDGNIANLRSMGFGDASAGFGAEYGNTGYVQVYDWNQRKPDTDSLTLTWRYAWSRIIQI